MRRRVAMAIIGADCVPASYVAIRSVMSATSLLLMSIILYRATRVVRMNGAIYRHSAIRITAEKLRCKTGIGVGGRGIPSLGA